MNIFLHSTRRQPIRTALLLLITALMVFAFTARAAEYLLVKQEADRLGGYYRAIGQLSQVEAAGQDHAASADEVVSLLENDPRVALVDRPRYPSAVMQGIYNADIGGTNLSINTKNLDFFFTGTFTGTAGTESGDVLCVFVPEELLSGYPEFIKAGRAVSVIVSQDEAAGAVTALNKGERYLVRGHFDRSKDLMFSATHAPVKFCALPLAENAPLFYHIAAGAELDWSAPALSGVEAEMRRCRDEQSALMAVTTRDMSAMPDAQPDSLLYLTEGRWLDSADQAAHSKVCVVNDAFAKLRGLRVGDTVTLTFRNVWNTYGYIDDPANGDIPGYETASDTFEIVGLYDYTIADMRDVTFYRNCAYFPDSAVPAVFDPFKDMRAASDLSFVLTSPAVKAEFLAQTQERLSALGLRAEFLENGWADFQSAVQPMLHASLYNLTVFALILATALCVVAFFYFRARRREIAIARALGVPAGACMRQGALPLALIGLAGTVCGTVSGWQYALSHGADTLASLSVFGGDAAGISLSRCWLAAIFGGVFLPALLLALGGMAYLSHRPTLELLQGGVQAKQKEEKTAAQAAPDMGRETQTQETAVAQAFAAAPIRPLPAAAAKPALGAAHTLRFVGCYIRRSKAKSLLVFLLAALFTVGLAAIRVSILSSAAKVDELYETVSVNLELVKRDSSIYVEGGFISQSTMDRIADTGFISNFYAEAECGVLDITREDARDAAGGAPAVAPDPSQEPQGPLYSLRSFSDLDGFLSGSGSGVDILYHAGWDEGMFSRDWRAYDEAHSRQAVLPVLLPQGLYEEYRITPGERIIVQIKRGSNTDVRLMEAAGMYTGAVSGGSAPVILTPAGAMDVIMKGSPYYSAARFSIDPAKNRELSAFRAALDAIINADSAGLVPLRTLLWDEDLRNVIEPLENSIRLMEVLYPVALALSLLAAAGVSALLILTEAREAAIMRVLGTTKLRSRVMLVLQIVFVVLAGLLIGLTAALAWSGSAGLAWAIFGMSALCAAAYLVCAVAGSAAGAVTVTNRPPLELLQVKE